MKNGFPVSHPGDGPRHRFPFAEDSSESWHSQESPQDITAQISTMHTCSLHRRLHQASACRWDADSASFGLQVIAVGLRRRSPAVWAIQIPPPDYQVPDFTLQSYLSANPTQLGLGYVKNKGQFKSKEPGKVLKLSVIYVVIRRGVHVDIALQICFSATTAVRRCGVIEFAKTEDSDDRTQDWASNSSKPRESRNEAPSGGGDNEH
ncbi:hypothetical protein EJ05DRAFT_534797 [Pseudovirgaria hyperparasitica]|uniref:Uncharacterized protein n=1 Tax=Pseudovirgaria hyperparasitica TaxID=470096 RepID=A0A6A6WML2_9PEZI|nr:uncharacterized protein EJ05DRAFT_534797 [Pseudovirgaria hyperparasitica]KAF2763451.1 hypothetical protein EJ05DRAFT_534797 [Pseudovirgaria hyperparasitica]